MTRPLAFWDSSALASIYLMEQASARHRRYARETRMVVWWATRVEAHGAACRYFRHLPNSEQQRSGAFARLASMAAVWQEVACSERVRALALRHLEVLDLRAADAMQLAAALVWCEERPRGRLFLTGDRKLALTASEVGFVVPAL